MILAIDTSTEKGSVAVGEGERLISERHLPTGVKASEGLFETLEQLQVSQLVIKRIHVGIGPGSFSGIRVSIAAARAIGLVHKCPVYGICSAFSVAKQHAHVSRLGVFADARRGEFYGTIFERGALIKPTRIYTLGELEEEIGKVTLAVTADSLALVTEKAFPKASDLLFVPQNLPDWVSEDKLEPIYLRESVAK